MAPESYPEDTEPYDLRLVVLIQLIFFAITVGLIFSL